MSEGDVSDRPGPSVPLRPGVTAEDVRCFFARNRQLCGENCSGRGLPTVVYVGGQASVYCNRSCREPVATVEGGRVHFHDPDAKPGDVARRFDEFQLAKAAG